MTIIFNGREFASRKEEELKRQVKKLEQAGITPKLVSILVGNDPGSKLYVSLKKKAAERIGAKLQVINLNSSINLRKIVQTIEEYNNDNNVHGIMVQLPLPDNLKLKTKEIVDKMNAKKDVDGLKEKSPFISATVKAILQIIKVAEKETSDDFKNVVVIGSSGVVGKPLVRELKKLGHKVTGCDIRTKNLKLKTKNADLLISATGVSSLVRGDMVKNGAVVIDVGSPKGDILFGEVSQKSSFITPVPGGVGPVTIVSLLENLVLAAKKLV